MAHRWQAHPRRRAPRSAWLVVPTIIGALAILAAVLSPGTVAVARSAATTPMPPSAEHAAVAPPPATLAASLRPRPDDRVGPANSRARPRVKPVPPVAKAIAVRRAGRGSTAVFLGDSYTSGFQGAGIGTHGWPQIVGRMRGWRVVNYAVPGTGFLNPGWTGQPVGSLVSRAVARHPDVVVIAAGHNDSQWSPAMTDTAADRVIDRVHRSLPGAVIVVIGPIWQDGSPPARCLALRDHLRRTAAAVGALFVDPIRERWFAGARHGMIRADGIHPDDAGHRWIAGRVLLDLARGGV